MTVRKQENKYISQIIGLSLAVPITIGMILTPSSNYQKIKHTKKSMFYILIASATSDLTS